MSISSISSFLQSLILEKQVTSAAQEETPVKSMTYNLRVQEANDDGPQYWSRRENAVMNMLSGKAANGGQPYDFLALQECGKTNPNVHDTWYKTLTKEMEPGGKLQDYGCVSIPGDKQDNLILFNKHKWSLDPNHEPQSFGIKGRDGKTEPGDLIGAAFKQIGNPNAKDIFVFGGHLPHAGNAPSSLQEVANDIHDFEGSQESSKDWADNYQTLFMMDSNDKVNDGGNNPSYDTDGAMNWAGIHDIYYDTHNHFTSPSDFTNNAWPVEKGESKTPSLREDIQFVSGNDTSAANTSEVIHYKENVDGTFMNPSDHLAVVNTTYFKSITTPVHESLSPHIGGFLPAITEALNRALMEEQTNHLQRGAV